MAVPTSEAIRTATNVQFNEEIALAFCVDRRFAPHKPLDITDALLTHSVQTFPGIRRNMCRNQDLWVVEVRVIRRRRLIMHDIQSETSYGSVIKCPQHRLLVYEVCSRIINDIDALLHERQGTLVNNVI